MNALGAIAVGIFIGLATSTLWAPFLEPWLKRWNAGRQRRNGINVLVFDAEEPLRRRQNVDAGGPYKLAKGRQGLIVELFPNREALTAEEVNVRFRPTTDTERSATHSRVHQERAEIEVAELAWNSSDAAWPKTAELPEPEKDGEGGWIFVFPAGWRLTCQRSIPIKITVNVRCAYRTVATLVEA